MLRSRGPLKVIFPKTLRHKKTKANPFLEVVVFYWEKKAVVGKIAL